MAPSSIGRVDQIDNIADSYHHARTDSGPTAGYETAGSNPRVRFRSTYCPTGMWVGARPARRGTLKSRGDSRTWLHCPAFMTANSSMAVTARPSLTTSEVALVLRLDTSPSAHVRVVEERVATLARHLRELVTHEESAPATWDDESFWNVEAHAQARSQYIAVGNSVNFRFWRLERAGVVPVAGEIDGQSFRGAMYMWRCLRRVIDQGRLPLLDAHFLANLSDADFDAIFSDDTGRNPLDVARDERIANLRDLGAKLLESWDGRFYNVASATGGSIVEFARLSAGFRAFDDPLYKLTMVNAIIHSGSGVYGFRDEPLPAIDYHLLRHALRQGMVEPDPRLAVKLREGQLLDAREALELRRVALCAYIDLADQSKLSGEVLDNMYWQNRVNCTDKPICIDPATAARCPFLKACVQRTEYQIPLELTRYY